VFATLRADALVIGTDPFFNSRSEQLAALAIRHAVPTIYQYRAFAAAGGLLSYGGSFTEPFRQTGIYTGRILKGEKPQSSSPRRSSWSSTSRPRRLLASPCRCRCSGAPMR
jgi:putative ABC transport system substrate-binding protein